MKFFLINLLSIILTFYIMSIIIFKQYYFNYTHFVNLFFLGIFFILMLYEKEHRYKINSIIVLYFSFILIALGSSLWGIDFVGPSYKALQLFIILINLFIIYNIIKRYSLYNTFLNGVLLGSFINYLILFGFLNVSFEVYTGFGPGARALGTMGNPNILATTMVISMLVSMIYLYRKEKINKYFYYYQFINIFAAMYIIMLTISKKGIVLGTLLLSAYIMLSIKSRKGMFQVGVMVIFGIIIAQYFIDFNELYVILENAEKRFSALAEGISAQDSANNSTTIRKNLIEFGLYSFQSNPLLGYGLDNFRLITTGQYAHNTPVELLVGVGLIGTLAYYGMHLILLKKIYNMKKSDLKYLLYIFVFSVLLMDMATVSYGNKLILFSILYMSIIAENESKYFITNTVKD